MPEAPRVIVADPDDASRRDTRRTLQSSDAVVVAEADGADAAVELALHYEPDVVLVDAALAWSGRRPVLPELRRRAPEVRTLVVVAPDDEDTAVQALIDGASGVAAADVTPEALPAVVRAAVDGQAPVPRALVPRLLAELRDRTGGSGLRPVRSPLTERQWEVLDLLCAERTTAEIADALVISIETVRSHVKSILRRLDVGSRAEAVKAAAQLRAEHVPPPGDAP